MAVEMERDGERNCVDLVNCVVVIASWLKRNGQRRLPLRWNVRQTSTGLTPSRCPVNRRCTRSIRCSAAAATSTTASCTVSWPAHCLNNILYLSSHCMSLIGYIPQQLTCEHPCLTLLCSGQTVSSSNISYLFIV